jgi:uncharacterized protein (DUF983 family)
MPVAAVADGDTVAGATTVQQPQVGPVLWHVLLKEPAYFVTHFWRPLMLVAALLLVRAVVWLIAGRRNASKQSA